jgi:hypothetical protein
MTALFVYGASGQRATIDLRGALDDRAPLVTNHRWPMPEPLPDDGEAVLR